MSPTAPLRIGTRGSTLATTQAGHVRAALIAQGIAAELTIVVTPGDQSQDPVAKIGVGVFTSALRDALLSGEVDLAVHSMKDLPTAQDPRFVLAALPPREDPRDVLIARDGLTLAELPAGATIGTSAPRRVAQLQALGLGWDIRPLRGNIESRIIRVRTGELDAVLLARAGLNRVERGTEATETLDPLQVLPAPAQGALAVECLADNAAVIAALRFLDDADTRAAVTAERTVLAELEAGCTAPVGALAEIVDDLDEQGAVIQRISLQAVAAAADGSQVIRASQVGDYADPVAVGRALAEQLLERGAKDLIGASAAESPPHPSHNATRDRP